MPTSRSKAVICTPEEREHISRSEPGRTARTGPASGEGRPPTDAAPESPGCFPEPDGKPFGTVRLRASSRDHTNRSIRFPERACRVVWERSDREGVSGAVRERSIRFPERACRVIWERSDREGLSGAVRERSIRFPERACRVVWGRSDREGVSGAVRERSIRFPEVAWSVTLERCRRSSGAAGASAQTAALPRWAAGRASVPSRRWNVVWETAGNGLDDFETCPPRLSAPK